MKCASLPEQWNEIKWSQLNSKKCSPHFKTRVCRHREEALADDPYPLEKQSKAKISTLDRFRLVYNVLEKTNSGHLKRQAIAQNSTY